MQRGSETARGLHGEAKAPYLRIISKAAHWQEAHPPIASSTQWLIHWPTLTGCSSINQKSCKSLKKLKALTFPKGLAFLFLKLKSVDNGFLVHLFKQVSKCVNRWHVTQQPGKDPSSFSKDWASRFFLFSLSEPGNHFPCHRFSNASWVGAVAIETEDLTHTHKKKRKKASHP